MAGPRPRRWRPRTALFALLAGGVAAYPACSDPPEDQPDPEEAELPYDLLCPTAGTDCADADGPLMVGVGLRDITPAVTETFLDCGLDNLCPGDVGYVAPDAGELDGEFNGHWSMPDGVERFDDANGNGFFDAVWIAGYGNGRPAQGVHDPIWARAVVLRKGETTLALVAVDLVGYFYDSVKLAREELGAELGVDLLLVAATHTHEAPDSVGIWGFDEGTTGVDPVWMETVRAAIIDSVSDAVDDLAEATAISAAGIPDGHPNPAVLGGIGFYNLVDDGRDPVVMDAEMRILQFRRNSDDGVIATVVNWTSHPESLDDKNAYISSDFVHYLREVIEDGIDRDGFTDPGEGGMAMFINGPVGGMQSQGNLHIIDLDGTTMAETNEHTASPDDPFFARPRAYGQIAGLDALRILRANGEELVDPDLSFATKSFMVPVENRGYRAMFITGVFYGACDFDKAGTVVPRRCVFDFDESAQITDDNQPNLETEVALINLGDVQMLTAPGELLPEWFVGGYDGSHTNPVQDLIDGWHNQEHGVATTCTDDATCGLNGDAECETAELLPGRVCSATNCCCQEGLCRSDEYNPPDLTLAPGPPYFEDRMTRPTKWLLGLCPDELGYIIPGYDYKLDERQPYIEDAPGHHYEETNSVGVSIGPILEGHVINLLEALP